VQFHLFADVHDKGVHLWQEPEEEDEWEQQCYHCDVINTRQWKAS